MQEIRETQKDVVVAGIGIAGSFALRAISKKYDVIGIDKREKLGFPVECGELVPTKNEMRSLLPNLKDYSLFDIPEKFVSNKTKRFKFVIPNGKCYDIEFDMLVINRDKFIQKIAEKSGHEIWLKTRVSKVNVSKEGKINVKTEVNATIDCPRIDIIAKKLDKKEEIKLSSRTLIASDGANSRIAKSLGVWNYEIAAAKQYVMEKVECDEDTVYMFVGNNIAPGGYAWIIPKGNGIANVGVGIRQSFLAKGDSIHNVLDRFVKKYPYSSRYLKNAKIIRKIGAVAPVDKPLDKTVFGKIMLVGDSASMILSHVAAGIPISMIAGDIAGKIINAYFEGKTSLEDYDRVWRSKMIDAIMRSYKIKQLWDEISETDEKLCRYFKFISNKDVATILRSRIPLKLRVAEPFMPLMNKIM